MKKMTGNEIRQTWLNFFKSKGHMIEPGASLIPHNDKTLLWINSGVAALKKYFDGSEIPDCRRITNVQKSIRTNDITNVGKTARHHTFFEMLGNFSIGDYFRDEVIPWAYEILTSPSYFGMDPENLYFTYNPTDKETFALWKKCGVKESHLIPLEGNYWEIGAGPCGPNTEVFYDRGESWDKDHLGIRLLKEDIDNDRYIELWGIVFSQYNAEPGKPRSEYKELPSKNIDTGAGLERIACILQGAETNFDTDLFMPVINATQKLATKTYADPNKMAYRVIADHIKTITFAIADGEYFSNEGRGYVLRRLLRRAMRYGQKIGINTTFMFKLVPVVKDMMKGFYPYLEGKEDYIAKIVKGEEEKFLKTLGTGEALLDKAIEGKKELSGADAFKLYDTFGFPIEMTKEICEEKGIGIDMAEFEKEMDAQKERARSARGDIQSMNKQSKDLLDFKESSQFRYDLTSSKAKVIGLFKDGVRVKELEDKGEVAFDITPFCSESGGQVGDSGRADNKDCSMRIIDSQKAPNGQHLHVAEILFGSVKEGDEFTLQIDEDRRRLTARNHSATHLL